MRIFGLMLLAATIVGCGGGNGGTQPPQLVFTSLRLAPTGPTIFVSDNQQLTATALDQNGAPLAGVTGATFTTSDQSKVSVNANTGVVTGVAAGSATITASLTSGGVTKTASTLVTVRAVPLAADVVASGTGTTFDPNAVTIASGGTVTWSFPGIAHNVIFSGAGPTGGNISASSNGATATRTFPVAGPYPYECTIHQGLMSGSVTVR